MLLNLIKAEGFRAVKMKSTIILTITLILVVLINAVTVLKIDFLGAYGIDMEQLQTMVDDGDEMDAFIEAFDAGTMIGMDVAANPEAASPWGKGLMYYEDVPMIFVQTVSSLSSLLVMAIFIGLFMGDIYSHDLEKNYILATHKRSQLFIARAVVIGFYNLGAHIIAFLATILSAALMAESVKLNIDKSAVLYFIITLFISYVFAILVMTVCNVTRSKVAGIVVGVLMSTGLVTDLIGVIDYLAKRQFHLDSDFSIGNYTIISNLGAITLHTEGNIITRALVCSVIYLVIFVIANIICGKRRDIV